MQKNYRCPGCGSTMEFLPSAQKMYCAYCGSMHTVEELNALTGESSKTGTMEDAGESTIAYDPWAGALGDMKPAMDGSGMTSPGLGIIGMETKPAEAEVTQHPPKKQASRELLDDSWLYGGNGSYGETDAFGTVTDPQKAKEIQRRHATIQMKILHCNACGAELAMNGVEASSFCSYCGQATVVMDRVEDYLQPDYVMPFRITKDQAEQIIRTRLREGYFIPEGIKNFELEKLRGIYVPFWLYDVYYGDDQYWKYRVKRGKSSVTRYSHRIGDCHFHKMTLDASKNFNDDSSQRLEPYDMRELQEFDAAYLSGFYSDRFDVGTDDLDALAYKRARELFNENMEKTIRHGGAKLEHSSPFHRVIKREYALLPVWFLTFRYEDMPYTILVNGQTGKMVGAVPFVKKKAYLMFGLLAVLFCVLFSVIGAFLTPAAVSFSEDGKIAGTYFTLIFLAITSTWSIAIQKYKAMIVSIGLTRSGTTSKYVKERQDKE